MKFDEIMRKITSGLTGNAKIDIKYIQTQMEEYKNHDLSTEILRACGRIMAELLPTDVKTDFSRVINNDLKGISETLDEVRFNVYKKNLEKADKLIANLVKMADEYPMFKDDSQSQYFCFHEFFEEILYVDFFQPKKDLRRSNLPFDEIYLQQGSLLFEEKKYMEARAALEKSRKWNPVNLSIAFEYIETFKVTGEIEKFAKLTKDAFKFAFRSADIARCARNLGYYYTEIGKYDVAIVCYFYSLSYDRESKNAQSELYYIQNKTGEKTVNPSKEMFDEITSKYKLPFESTNRIIGMSIAYGKHAVEQKQTEAAIYFFEIAYGLTEDEELKEVIDHLNDAQEVEKGNNSEE